MSSRATETETAKSDRDEMRSLTMPSSLPGTGACAPSNAARRAEAHHPPFEERLLTLTERIEANPGDPFLELLADDTLRVAQQAGFAPERVHLHGNNKSESDLVAAVEWQLREFEARSGIACDFTCDVDQVSLEGDRATAVFRLVQEALTNIGRHAEATEAQVVLREEAGELLVQVKDNGRGITEQELRSTKSLGLLGMRERVNLLDGDIQIAGVVGKGTTISVRLSLAPLGAK